MEKDIARILIFDMDGTLIDSMSDHAIVFSEILKTNYGIESGTSQCEYLKTAGRPLDEQFLHTLALVKINQVPNLDNLIGEFWKRVEKMTPILFPDVSPALSILKDLGYYLFVISSCTQEIVTSKLTKTGIIKYFILTLGTNKEIPNMVKGSGHFSIIRAKLGISNSEFKVKAIMIGDSKFDIQIGKKEGLITVSRLTNGNRKGILKEGADLIISNFYELVEYLQMTKD